MTLVRCLDPERRGAQTGGERSVAADFDPGSPLAIGAEHGELARVAGQGETRPGSPLTRRRRSASMECGAGHHCSTPATPAGCRLTHAERRG